MATQKAWKSEFDFLQFSSRDMFCKVCLRFDDEIKSCENYHPTFINGCTNFRKSAVADHSRTDMHQKTVEHQRKSEAEHLGEKYTKKLTPLGTTAIGDSIRSMAELTHEQRKNLEKLFHIAYFIGYKGRPYTDFMDLLELEKLHEVKFFKTSSYEN